MDDLSLTGKLWRLPSTSTASEGISALFARRHITNERPTLIAPSIFPDMHRAVDRIHAALERSERIGIFGDYDCDGVTAVAQLLRYFRRHECEPWIRLPHRVRDGYGLKPEIVREVLAEKITLLITADTGITAINEIRMLQEQGTDVIITDHHHVQEEVPLAFAIIHPGLCNYPAPHPSGAGVVYKLIHALEGAPWDDMESDTALAMLGTVADLVELRGENRALTQLGLQALEVLSGTPLSQLRERCRSKDRPLSATDIAFRMAPRINAAGRMSEPGIALKALTEGGDALALLDLLNEQRQSLTRELCDRALHEFDEENLPPILVTASDDYPHGIVGLIAGRLTEQFGRPSLVAHTDGRTCTASLRSTDAYNITLGLSKCHALLQSYGGHAQAAGCTFALKNLEAITETLCRDIESHIDPSTLVPTLSIDMEISSEQISTAFCNELQALEPFGQGNPEPLFLLRNISLEDMRPCGQEDRHLTGRMSGVKCVGFNLGSFASRREKVDAAVRIELNEWNGKTEPQLVIVDIADASRQVSRLADWQIGRLAS